MKNDKSPDNDGLKKEFMKPFGKKLKPISPIQYENLF